jgi:hypothetical protein
MSPLYLFVFGMIFGAFVRHVLGAVLDRAFDLRERVRRGRGRGYWKKVKIERDLCRHFPRGKQQ